MTLHGFRTHADGHVLLDISTRVGTVLGEIITTKSNDYVAHPAFALGEPVWNVETPGASHYALQPKLSWTTVGGVRRIVWTWRVSGAAGNQPVHIIYGVA
ncbi:hypothetical protein [Brevundimonas sp.]|uniref:hypothetical protein n=1 Tax=Brevundimonas sp. TaxID=1871086 RepID=UPI0035B48B67